MEYAAIVWFILMLVFIVAEAMTVSLVSTWFAVGALAAMVTSLLGGELWLQVVIFVAVSGVLLALLRPIAKKHFTPKLTRTNVDSVVGAEGIVSRDIDNIRACGQVKLGSMEWSARSTSGEPIEANARIRVDRVEGVKVYVSPVEVTVSK